MSHTDTEHRGTRIGYTRVSTVSQTLDQQNEALTAATVTKTFSDNMSGARDDRPGLAALMDLMIGVLGSLAEYERELTKARTALKRATSRANGTKFGRPRKVGDTDHIATAKGMKADGHTGKDIAKYLGVSRATLHRYLSAA
jgi:DNA invertase Pin-like site-specific DNA recombinase